VFELIYRLYQRDVGSGSYRHTLAVALVTLAVSVGILLALARLPFHEVLVADGVVEPRQLELVHSETTATIQRNLLRLGETYRLGAPIFSVTAADGSERVYTAPCRCVLIRSELWRRSAGEVRAGELIAELIDPTEPEVRFSVTARWRGAIAAGAKVHVLDEAGQQQLGAITRVYPRRAERLGLEAVVTMPKRAALTLGAQVAVRFEAPEVPLWQFFLNNLGH
jgi:HlyD family secretion protein